MRGVCKMLSDDQSQIPTARKLRRFIFPSSRSHDHQSHGSDYYALKQLIVQQRCTVKSVFQHAHGDRGMNAGDLVLGCIADSYFRSLKTLGGLFTAPEYVTLSGRTYTLGRSLGSGGAADVFVATAYSSLGDQSAPEQYALKKV